MSPNVPLLKHLQPRQQGSRRSRSQPQPTSNSYSGFARFEIARHGKLGKLPTRAIRQQTERPSILEPDKINSNGNTSITPEAVSAAIFRAVDTLNETLAKTQQVRKSGDTVLIDSKGSLDSMALVNLIVFVEDEMAQAFGRQLDLTGGDPFEEQDLKTLGSMTDALCRKLAA